MYRTLRSRPGIDIGRYVGGGAAFVARLGSVLMYGVVLLVLPVRYQYVCTYGVVYTEVNCR